MPDIGTAVLFSAIFVSAELWTSNERKNMERTIAQMSDEKRMVGTYIIEQSLFIGDKEVVFGVDKTQEAPFMVCYCDYHNPLSAAWPTEAIGSDD